MRVDSFNEDYYFIYINNIWTKDIDFNSKEEIISIVKEMIIKVQELYSFLLKGFYSVDIYSNQKVGLFLEIEKLDDIDYGNTIDLKILVHMNQTMYLKMDNFDYIPDGITVLYDGNYYYINIDKIDFINMVEYGDIVYGEKVEKHLEKCTKIKNTNVF